MNLSVMGRLTRSLEPVKCSRFFREFALKYCRDLHEQNNSFKDKGCKLYFKDGVLYGEELLSFDRHVLN